ncbi:ATP-binding cassette domain-containing protein [Streptomyces sp. NPDC058534]|uniref:ABC transporter ATP-binding protein n=1 Tax=Streptomyces sp. NPDC058534 TaxID=3346541 RepID=UPI00366264A9
MTDDIIVARALTKRFRTARKRPGLRGAVRHLLRGEWEERTAVDAIDLRVAPGESVAYVGPNGAGKSTTVKMLTGVLTPTSGDLSVAGVVPYADRTANARNIGVVFGQRTQLWWDLPVRESFRLLADIYLVPQRDFTRRLDELVALLGIEELLERPVRQLSLGQRVTCDVAAALLHAPPVLFLDEPTIGLDVSVKARLREFLGTLNRERGVTVVLTSHDLGDVESLCGRIVLIDRARILLDMPVSTMLATYGTGRTVTVRSRERLSSSGGARFEARYGDRAVIAQHDAHTLLISYDQTSLATADVISYALTDLPLDDIHVGTPGIEEIIRDLYEGAHAVG